MSETRVGGIPAASLPKGPPGTYAVTRLHRARLVGRITGNGAPNGGEAEFRNTGQDWYTIATRMQAEDLPSC